MTTTGAAPEGHITTTSQERLVYMANQIARNFEAQGDEAAVRATAEHIVAFWDPRMKTQIVACLNRGDSGLGPTAARAVAQLGATVAAQ